MRSRLHRSRVKVTRSRSHRSSKWNRRKEERSRFLRIWRPRLQGREKAPRNRMKGRWTNLELVLGSSPRQRPIRPRWQTRRTDRKENQPTPLLQPQPQPNTRDSPKEELRTRDSPREELRTKEHLLLGKPVLWRVREGCLLPALNRSNPDPSRSRSLLELHPPRLQDPLDSHLPVGDPLGPWPHRSRFPPRHSSLRRAVPLDQVKGLSSTHLRLPPGRLRCRCS
jgi:hypothetical protein